MCVSQLVDRTSQCLCVRGQCRRRSSLHQRRSHRTWLETTEQSGTEPGRPHGADTDKQPLNRSSRSSLMNVLSNATALFTHDLCVTLETKCAKRLKITLRLGGGVEGYKWHFIAFIKLCNCKQKQWTTDWKNVWNNLPVEVILTLLSEEAHYARMCQWKKIGKKIKKTVDYRHHGMFRTRD